MPNSHDIGIGANGIGMPHIRLSRGRRTMHAFPLLMLYL